MIVLGILLCGSINADDPAESKECKFWHQLAYNLSHAGEVPEAGFLQFACNSTCSSITCSGHMSSLKLPVDVPSDLDFCFGIRLNHCDNPVDMDYYLTIPSYNLTKLGSISHNDTYVVPVLARSKSVSMLVVVEMVPINTSYILFGITGKLKLTLAGIDEFPYTEKVFPPTLIDVPPCLTTGSPKTPFVSPNTCVGPPKPAGSTASPVKISTVKPVVKSKTLNGSCEFGLEQCSQYEMCTTVGKARGGICVCDTSSYFDGTVGLCLPKDSSKPPGTLKPSKLPTTTNKPSVTEANKTSKAGTNIPGTLKPSKLPTTTNKPSVTEANKNSKAGTNMTPVIIGAVFGGLLLIVVVVSVIIYIGRRRRQATLRGRHQLLMDHEDDDDVRNLVI
ncbi:hypothetical protein ACF0H5_019589 [Mactra antiquata]